MEGEDKKEMPLFANSSSSREAIVFRHSKAETEGEVQDGKQLFGSPSSSTRGVSVRPPESEGKGEKEQSILPEKLSGAETKEVPQFCPAPAKSTNVFSLRSAEQWSSNQLAQNSDAGGDGAMEQRSGSVPFSSDQGSIFSSGSFSFPSTTQSDAPFNFSSSATETAPTLGEKGVDERQHTEAVSDYGNNLSGSEYEYESDSRGSDDLFDSDTDFEEESEEEEEAEVDDQPSNLSAELL